MSPKRSPPRRSPAARRADRKTTTGSRVITNESMISSSANKQYVPPGVKKPEVFNSAIDNEAALRSYVVTGFLSPAKEIVVPDLP